MKRSKSSKTTKATKTEKAPAQVSENFATQVRWTAESRGTRNLPGFYVAMTNAAGKAISKIYTCIGEQKARTLALAMARNHRLPIVPQAAIVAA